jgi:hypothetical protein
MGKKGLNINFNRIFQWRVFVALCFAPIIIIGLAYGLAWLEGRIRYDPAYFTQEYLERYQTPDRLIRDVEIALNKGDQALMAELQASRFPPGTLQARPNIIYSALLGREGPYLNYLLYDTVTFHRYLAPVKAAGGRYVLVPVGLYYFFDSGRWGSVFIPPAIFWWSFLLVISASIWVYRRLASYRNQLFGGK